MLFSFAIYSFRNKERHVFGNDSMTSRARFPRTARIRIFASTTRALLGIPLFLAGGPTDLLVLVHQLIFTGTPCRDHFVEVLRGGAHCGEFCFAAAFLCGNVETKRLSVPHNRQRSAGFEVACEVLAELADTDLNSSHIVYSLYTILPAAIIGGRRGWRGCPERFWLRGDPGSSLERLAALRVRGPVVRP